MSRCGSLSSSSWRAAEAASATEALALISIQGSDGEREVHLSHPLYGETVRAGLGTLRASELRLALATCVQARGELKPADSLRVARWLQDADAAIPNALLLDAARAANLSGDPELGAELAARALEAGAGPDAALVLARCDQVRKRFAEAESVLAGIEGKIESQDTAIAYLEQRMSALYWGLRRPEEAQALLARALDWWPDEEWVRRLLPIRLHLSSLVGGKRSAVTMSAVLLYDDELDAGLRRDLKVGHAMNLFYTGRVVEAGELLRRLRPQLPLTGHGDELALIGLGVVEIHSGVDLARIEREMTHTLTEAVRLGDHGAAGVAAIVVGSVASLAGRYRDATRWLSEAELHYEQQDTFGALVIARQALVSVARQTGNTDRTIETARRCLDALQGRDPLPPQVPYVARARAWEAEARGDLITAQRILLDTADNLSDDPLHGALMLYEAIRIGASARRFAATMAAMRSRCDARLVAAYADHAAALAARSGPALLEVAEEFARIGTLRYATEAAAQAATAFLQSGRQDSARRAAARSRELFVDGQGGTLPAIEGLDGSASELTAREAQLVELARQGLVVSGAGTTESWVYAVPQSGLDKADPLRYPTQDLLNAMFVTPQSDPYQTGPLFTPLQVAVETYNDGTTNTISVTHDHFSVGGLYSSSSNYGCSITPGS
ncbi:MAG: hypothetical protein ACLP0J_16800 [Solirubrobacteraceae bacterium]